MIALHAAGLDDHAQITLKRLGCAIEDGYKSARRFYAADALWIDVPLATLAAATPLLLPALKRYLGESKYRASSRNFHSVEAVEYLENMTGMRLPRPSY